MAVGGSLAGMARVVLRADTAGYTRDMNKAEKQLGQFTRGAISGTGVMHGFGRSIAFASGAFLGAAGFSAAVRAGFDELAQGQKVAAQTNAVLKSTGEIAGVTAGHVDALGSSLLRKTGIDDEAIKSGENLLLTFTNVRNVVGEGNDVFDQATKAALDMSVAMGTDLNTAVLQVGKALQDPIKGATALRRVGVALTDSQKDQIKTLVQTGRTMEAQKIIVRELTTEFGGSAEAAGKTLPGQINILRETFKNLEADLLRGAIPSIQSLTKWLQRQVDAFQNNKAAQQQVKDAFHDLGDAAKTAGDVIEKVDGVTGGLKNTLKDLFALGVASKIYAMSGAFTKLAGTETAAGAAGAATGIGGAAGKAGLLLRSLKALTAIGAITIGIDLIINKKDRDNVLGFLQYIGEGGPAAGLLDKVVPRPTRDNGGGGDFAPLPAANAANRRLSANIVSTARSQIGIPYQLGGAAILGQHTDCSGLAQAVLRKNGINVPRVTYDQWTAGTPVDMKHLQPGDLIFYNMGPRGPEHVAIYIGNGNVIVDPHTGASVQETTINGAGSPVGARRYTRNFTSSGGGGVSTGEGTALPPASFSLPKMKGAFGATRTASTGSGSIIPANLRLAQSQAALTKGNADDILALKGIEKYLEARIQSEKNIEKKIDLLNELASTRADIASKQGKKNQAAADAKAIPHSVTGTFARVSPISSFVEGVAAVLSEAKSALGGNLRETIDIPGLGKILYPMQPTIESWDKLIGKLKTKLIAAVRRQNALRKSLAAAKRAKRPNKANIANIQKALRAISQQVQELRLDLGDAMYQRDQLAEEANSQAQQDADEAEAEAQRNADAQRPDDIVNDTVSDVSSPAVDTGPTPQELAAAADRALTEVPADIRLALAVAQGTDDTTDDIAATTREQAFLQASLGSVQDIENRISIVNQLNGVNASLKQLIDGQKTQIDMEQQQIDYEKQRVAFLGGLRDIRGFESNIYSPLRPLGGSPIYVKNEFTLAEGQDPHLLSKALEFELAALVS